MKQALALKQQSLLASTMDYILLDGSGSMSDKWWDSLDALENYMSVLRTQNIASHGILHIFDSTDIEYLARDSIIAEWPKFREQPPGLYGGSTPLYDAINLMGRRLAELDPPTATIIIMTDGGENGSKVTSLAQASAILNWLRAKGYQVIFLGADFNNSQQARALGAKESNSLGVQKRKLIEAGKVLGEKRLAHIRAGTDISFSDSEKKDFGGYLTDQTK